MRAKKINPFIVAYVVGLVGLAVLGYCGERYGAYALQHTGIGAFSLSSSQGTTYLDLPRMNFTVTSAEGQVGRVHLTVSLQVAKKDLLRLEDFQPRITDRIVNYVRTVDIDKVRHRSSLAWLKTDLLQEVNNVDSPVPVIDLTFKQFVIL